MKDFTGSQQRNVSECKSVHVVFPSLQRSRLNYLGRICRFVFGDNVKLSPIL